MSTLARTVKGGIDIPIEEIYGLAVTNSAAGTSLESSYTVAPSSDNSKDLGSSTKRWRDVYVGGTIFRSPIFIRGFLASPQAIAATTTTAVNFTSVAGLPTGFTYASGLFVNTTTTTPTVAITVSLITDLATVDVNSYAYIDRGFSPTVGSSLVTSNGASGGMISISTVTQWTPTWYLRLYVRLGSAANVRAFDTSEACIRIVFL